MDTLSDRKRLCLSSDGIMCAYVQIPFCRSLCSFCCWCRHYDPKEILNIRKHRAPYLRALAREIEERSAVRDERARVALKVIHFGGGTPSLLAPDELGDILQTLLRCYGQSPAEIDTIGIEVRQDDLSPSYLEGLRNAGFNRISIGAQTFDPVLLEKLHRRISPDDFHRCFEWIRRAGFDDVNIDLLYGFPVQSIDVIEADAEKAAALRPEHIDAHPWKDTGGCFDGIECNYQKEKGRRVAAARLVKTVLEEADYANYNHRCFSLPGRENLMHLIEATYSLPFLGFGAGAEQYRMPGNTTSVREYIRRPFDAESFARARRPAAGTFHFLNAVDSLFRQLLLPEGVHVPFYNRTQHCDLDDLLQRCSGDGRLDRERERCRGVFERSRIQIFSKILSWIDRGIIRRSGDWLRFDGTDAISPETWVLYMQAC